MLLTAVKDEKRSSEVEQRSKGTVHRSDTTDHYDSVDTDTRFLFWDLRVKPPSRKYRKSGASRLL
jgi:hypothetical protein